MEDSHTLSRRRVMVDGGHFDIRPRPPGTPLEGPTGTVFARLTDTALGCFRAAVVECLELRGLGVEADVGVLIGDLAVAGAHRPRGVASLPPAYLGILDGAGLDPEEVLIWSEASARNLGKKLVDRAKKRFLDPQDSYRRWGWSFVRDERGTLGLVSDASLDWADGMPLSILTRGGRALCPCIVMGHKERIARAGYTEHLGLYGFPDDGYIERKLYAAAAAHAALGRDQLDAHVHGIRYTPDGPSFKTTFVPEDFVEPGQLPFDEFVEDIGMVAPAFAVREG